MRPAWRSLSLMAAFTRYNIEMGLAYFGNNWSNLISTLFYNGILIVFVHAMFLNTKAVAGYSYADVMLIVFTSQLGFYLTWGVSIPAAQSLADDVNKGLFDFLLTKPLSSLWYCSIKQINLLWIARDGIPPMIIMSFFLPWHELVVAPVGLAIGILIFLLSLVVVHCFLMLLALPVFWVGQSEQVLRISDAVTGPKVPFEGFGGGWGYAVTALVPTFLLSTITTSVLIGKSNAWVMLGFTLVLLVVFVLVLRLCWEAALRAYSSASS